MKNAPKNGAVLSLKWPNYRPSNPAQRGCLAVDLFGSSWVTQDLPGWSNPTGMVNYAPGGTMPRVLNIEPTPNPDALKFLVSQRLLQSGVRSFRDFESAVGDPLGSALFALGHITSVFYMDRFVTVNKEPAAIWSDLIDPVCEALEDYDPPAEDLGAQPSRPDGTPDEKLARILAILDERVRPGLAGDGGGLEVVSFDGTTLQISYHGACGSCPSAGGGTLHYIEALLQDEVDPGLRVVSW
jgi:NFU1 iron-sulfur cluster scaffold homolog, mitochondrial